VLAAEAVWDAGVVPVTSAGNYGDKGNFTILSPGNRMIGAAIPTSPLKQQGVT